MFDKPENSLYWKMLHQRIALDRNEAIQQAYEFAHPQELGSVPIFSEADVAWLKELKVSVGPCI